MTDSGGEAQWYFSQVKGTMEDEVNEADIISTVEFNEDGELLATGDKGGRIVIFQREQPSKSQLMNGYGMGANGLLRTDYNVYSTFQSHEAEFDYLKSLEIEEKINKIKWLKRKNVAHFLLSTNDKTVKLWKIRERNKRAVMASADTITSMSTSASSSLLSSTNSMLNGHVSVRDDLNGYIRSVSIPVIKYMDRIEVEAIPKRIFANAHTYHINSISLNSDQETFMSADDLRINLWHIEITNQSFNIVDVKPANMEELAEVITAAEFHPKECNLFVYSSSKGIIRLCDMRQSALCDNQAKIFEEREDPTSKNFFSEIISSISDIKFSHSGRYLCTRDYLHIKVWDLNMENRPVETYSVHDYLRNKLCILYENDCIFDKFECSWSSNDDHILSGSYNNFFKSFNRNTKQELMFECSREQSRPRQLLRPKRVVGSSVNGNLNNNGQQQQQQQNGNASPSVNTKRNTNTTTNLNGNGTKSTNLQNSTYIRDDVNVDNLDFTKKILHTSWHPKDNIIAIAATNNLYIFYNKENSASSTPASTSAHFNTIMPNLNTNTFTTNEPSASTTLKTNQLIATSLEESQQQQQQHLQESSSSSVSSSTQDCSLSIASSSSSSITTCSQMHLSSNSTLVTINSSSSSSNQSNLNSSFYTAPTTMTTTATITPIPVTNLASSSSSATSTTSNLSGTTNLMSL